MLKEPERKWAVAPYTGNSLDGCDQQHVEERELCEKLKIASDKRERNRSTLDAIVLRSSSGVRIQPHQVQVSESKGLLGDRWSAGKALPGDQVSMMNLDIAYAIANSQSVVLFGDNLFTRLDLSKEALPIGTLVRIGPVLMQVSETPHVPCGQFRSRFGVGAFRLAAKEPRVRGIYLTVAKGGEIRIGDEVVVQTPTSS